MKKGVFITLEGLDGAGKTTQIKRLAAKAQALGIETVTTREPGGTALGDAIRKILLDPAYKEMLPLTEALLYAASRAQHVEEVIRPALRAGKLVICDRFLDSSLAYQAFGGGLAAEYVRYINEEAVKSCKPDRTFVLDLDPQEGQARKGQMKADRMEQKSLDFHKRVREGFLQIAQKEPERMVVLDAMESPGAIFNAIWTNVAPLLSILR